MKIVFCGTTEILEEAALTENASLIQVNNTASFFEHKDADGFINFSENAPFSEYPKHKPVLINNVLDTIPTGTPSNVIRFNGWPGFLTRQVWEVAGDASNNLSIFETALNKTLHFVKDAPGFIAPRVIAMIINEAYFALEEKVSTPKEIDTAMKLGTGYPYGPFEWAERIGIHRIAQLLVKLSVNDKRYQPATSLLQSISSR